MKTKNQKFYDKLLSISCIPNKWQEFRCWLRYHAKKDFFKIIKTAIHGYPWDETYLFELERAKLIEMANYEERIQRFVGWEYIVRDMRICIKLLGIMLEDGDYFHFDGDLTFTPLNDKEGNYKVGHTPDFKYVCDVKVNTKNIDRFEPRKEYQKALLDYPHELYMLKARYLYHKIRYEHELEWAD